MKHNKHKPFRLPVVILSCVVSVFICYGLFFSNYAQSKNMEHQLHTIAATNCADDARFNIRCSIPPSFGFSYPNTEIDLSICSKTLVPHEVERIIEEARSGPLLSYQRPENWEEMTGEERRNAKYGGLEFRVHVDLNGDQREEFTLFVPYVPNGYSVKIISSETIPESWQSYLSELQETV